MGHSMPNVALARHICTEEQRHSAPDKVDQNRDVVLVDLPRNVDGQALPTPEQALNVAMLQSHRCTLCVACCTAVLCCNSARVTVTRTANDFTASHCRRTAAACCGVGGTNSVRYIYRTQWNRTSIALL